MKRSFKMYEKKVGTLEYINQLSNHGYEAHIHTVFIAENCSGPPVVLHRARLQPYVWNIIAYF